MILCFPGPLFAEENVSIQDRIIGSTFKALAKAYVVTADIGKLKQKNIDKINKMDEGKFQDRYSKVYAVLKDLPSGLTNYYRIGPGMTKGEVIESLESLDKAKMYKIIDAVPDTVIAAQFKAYLAKTREQIQESNTVEQIKKFWNKIIKKAYSPT